MKSCATYWGSHGCYRPPGHPGPHHCSRCCESIAAHEAGHPEDPDAPDHGCVGWWPYYGPDTRFTDHRGDEIPGEWARLARERT